MGAERSPRSGTRAGVAEEARGLLAPYGRHRVLASGDLLWREGPALTFARSRRTASRNLARARRALGREDEISLPDRPPVVELPLALPVLGDRQWVRP
jgi:hypothetical protein